MSKILEISPQQACSLLRKECVVALPTETVYGLCASACCAKAVERIFFLKKRPKNRPLIVHCAKAEDVDFYTELSKEALALIHAFWPGPLSLLVRLKPQHTLYVDGYRRKALEVVIRVPASPLMRWIIKEVGNPLVAPSANTYQKLSPTRAHHIALNVPTVRDDHQCSVGLESTIIDVRSSPARCLRLGGCPLHDIENVLGYPLLHNNILSTPGQGAHYAPHKPLRLNVSQPHPSHSIFLWKNTPNIEQNYAYYQVLSPTGCVQKASHRFYDMLHDLDQQPTPAIDVLPCPFHEGQWRVMQQKLQQAAHSLER